MALQRHLVLCFLVISFLLSIYIVCVSLELWVPWRMDDLAGAHYSANSSKASSMTQDFLKALLSIHPVAFTIDPKPFSWDPMSSGNKHSATSAPPAKSKRLATTKQAPDVPMETTKFNLNGDTYGSDDVQPQTTCPDAITKKWSSTEFKDRFLATIPVLQWAKHVTPKNYQHLRHWGGVYGWGAMNYETLKATLSVLNLTANHQMFDDWELRRNGSQCIRCAVVGNGGILNNSRKGVEIDGHDYVFRTNGAVLEGFAQDVGTRTTHYSFSTNTMRNSMRSYKHLGYNGPPVSKETRYVFLPDHDRDYLLMKAVATHTAVEQGPEKSNSPPKFFGDDASAEKLKMIHPDFSRYLKNRFLRSQTLKTRYANIYRPSTGSLMLLAALHTCDQVSAYGFMTPDYIKYSDHYYDKKYHRVVFYANHDFRLEMNLWQQLHKAGIMQLYMRP